MSNASFCWHCGKKLDLRSFGTIKDHDGNLVRVHHVCKPDAAAVRSEAVFTAKLSAQWNKPE